MERLKQLAENKQHIIDEKVEAINAMEQTGMRLSSLLTPILQRHFPEKDLRYELKVEVNKSKDLAIKLGQNPPGVARFKAGSAVPDPKHGEVIKFYEDLTNLLITNVKPQPSKSDDSEWILSCIFTFVDTDDITNDVKKSKL